MGTDKSKKNKLFYMENIRLKAIPEKIAKILKNFYKKTKGDTEASKREWFKRGFKTLREMSEMGFTGVDSIIMDLQIIHFKVYNKRFESSKHKGYGI